MARVGLHVGNNVIVVVVYGNGDIAVIGDTHVGCRQVGHEHAGLRHCSCWS